MGNALLAVLKFPLFHFLEEYMSEAGCLPRSLLPSSLSGRNGHELPGGGCEDQVQCLNLTGPSSGAPSTCRASAGGEDWAGTPQPPVRLGSGSGQAGRKQKPFGFHSYSKGGEPFFCKTWCLLWSLLTEGYFR